MMTIARQVGIHIDRFRSLKDWYLCALYSSYWNKCIKHLRCPSKPAPIRPNRTDGPRRSSRNHSKMPRQEPEQEQEPRQWQWRQSNREDRISQNVSPPRKNNNRSRDFDPANVGSTMYDLLKKIGLNYSAS